MSDFDNTMLKKALALARIRRGFCAPNPSVGAVLVREGAIISEGYHWAAGEPHAEVNALAGQNARGATLYITLEPCCHWGRTPPCTEAILKSGARRVVYAFSDPNPAVAGRGEKQLNEAGVECIRVRLPEIDEFYKSYHHWTLHRRPWVTAKLAVSLDGKIAREGGKPASITGEPFRVFTHERRKSSDAILTSARTILFDNPRLDARLDGRSISKPIFIIDPKLETPADAWIIQNNDHVTLLHGIETNPANKAKTSLLGDSRVKRCEMPVDENSRGNLEAVLKIIGDTGVHDLWVEAGGRLFDALASQRLLHEAFLAIGPCWLGDTALSAFTQTPWLADAKITWSSVGSDAVCRLEW